MIDVSDGLAKDLRTLCAESGVGAIVREEALPVPGAVGEIFGLDARLSSISRCRAAKST